MNKLKIVAIISVIVLSVTSCNNDKDYLSSEDLDQKDPFIEVVDLVRNFEKTSQTKSGNVYSDSEDIVIDNYEKSTYTLPLISNIQTKALNVDIPDSASIDLYLVNFHKAGKAGFSIATADERIRRIYAYTEEGLISDTLDNPAMSYVIRCIPEIVVQDLQKYYNSLGTKAVTSTYVNIGPFLKTRWTQAAPYNNLISLCQYSGGQYNGHNAVGCVGTATAQIIAYYRKFQGTYVGNTNIDFDNLTKDPYIGSSDSRAIQVARFVREVAIRCAMVWSCDDSDNWGGGTEISDAYLLLKELGYSVDLKEHEEINLYRLYQNFQKKNVHLTRGNVKGKKIGHAWFWDGIRGDLSGTTFNNVLLHCNWGNSSAENPNVSWGNGWYATYEQPHGQSNYSENNSQCYISNYK